ncbi:MAG: hypothetical protein EBS87_09215 [Sphingomonadaceae bacterium]|nr:hypothetical protein [Sphingomonadaceae bacterium]
MGEIWGQAIALNLSYLHLAPQSPQLMAQKRMKISRIYLLKKQKLNPHQQKLRQKNKVLIKLI